MIERLAKEGLQFRLNHFPAACILGARQVGKITLARQTAEQAGKEAMYIDLENPDDRALLQDPMLFLRSQQHKLVIIDEVQLMPELFPQLRSLIDQHHVAGRFLLLGSASPDILRNTAESLAGRISYLHMFPFVLAETAGEWQTLWVRGGFPNAFLEDDERVRKTWFTDFINSYVQKDLPQLGLSADTVTTSRLLTMLANNQGGVLNMSGLGNALQLAHTTISKYVNFLENALLVKRVLPYSFNINKRLVRSPKCYLLDSGFVHSLLKLNNFEEVMGHMVSGGSWEGFVLQQLMVHLPADVDLYYYRTHDGAELDFVLEQGGKVVLAIEVKLSNAPTLSRGTTVALTDIGTPPLLVVTPGATDFPLREGVQVCSVATLPMWLSQYGVI
jgi:predicted AAA+ superfamily ATPase